MAELEFKTTWEDLARANNAINPMPISRWDKTQGREVTKDYAEVHQRVKAFRMVYPNGFIRTTMDSHENGVCIIRAEVGFYSDAGPVLLANGYAYEREGSSQVNKTSYIENCETSAVGRALGLAGFGIDTSIASADEMRNALHQQQQPTQPAPQCTDALNQPAQRTDALNQPTQPAVPFFEPAKDTPEEAEFRAMVETLYKPEDLARWMLKKFNMPFAATPVAMIKTVMPEDKVREEYARMTQPPAEAQQEPTTETNTEGGTPND